MTTAEQIMTENVTTIDATATLGDALEVMSERDVRHLPVVDGIDVVGMLSDRDLKGVGLSLVTDLESLERHRSRLQAAVSSVMTGDVLTVDRSADVSEVIDLLLEEKISAVPVVEEDTNTLVGIISTIDILRAVRDTLQ